MHAIAGIPLNRLADHRDSTLNRLKELSSTDKEWQPFYERRVNELSSLVVESNIAVNDATPSVDVLEEEAASALEVGNFEKLARLAEYLNKSS